MNKSLSKISFPRAFPRHGRLGIGLIAIFWPLNWTLSGHMPVTSWGFFPLWLGYCLTVDGLNAYLRGTSLYTRSGRKYIGLFLVSAPAWWLFEVLNWRVQNWYYVGRELFTDPAYGFLSSLSFSTVIPAVFGTAELIAGSDFMRRFRRGPVIDNDWRTTLIFALLGLGMFLLMMARPRFFFPFLWLSLYFMLAPINVWLGNRSLSETVRNGDWRPVIAIWFGTLTCGFFWEMWNFFSFPKWQYTVPFVDFLHVFEMPLLGYMGYLPFGLELFAIYHLVMGLLGQRNTDYVTTELFPKRNA